MMSEGGLYIGGGNRMQKEIGVQDTPDLIFADWARPDRPMGRFSDRELVRTHADNSVQMFEWLEKNGNQVGILPACPRSSRPRAHATQRGALAERTDNAGARFWFRQAAREDRAADGGRNSGLTQSR